MQCLVLTLVSEGTAFPDSKTVMAYISNETNIYVLLKSSDILSRSILENTVEFQFRLWIESRIREQKIENRQGLL